MYTLLTVSKIDITKDTIIIPNICKTSMHYYDQSTKSVLEISVSCACKSMEASCHFSNPQLNVSALNRC
jgi:hypothetical protein